MALAVLFVPPASATYPGADGTIYFVDVTSGVRTIRTVNPDATPGPYGPFEGYTQVDASPDGRLLLAVAVDGSLYLLSPVGG